MSPDLQIRVYRRRELCHTATLEKSIEIGRQRPGEPAPFEFLKDGNRLIVAPIDDKLVSREHLQLELVRDATAPGEIKTDSGHTVSQRISIKNLSRKRSVMVERHGKLAPQQTVVVNPPVLISFEDLAVRVESLSFSDVWDMRSLDHQTMAPGAVATGGTLSMITQRSLMAASSKETYEPEQLMRWLSEMMEVLHSAAGASDFMVQSVDAVSKIVRLDAVSALRYEDGEWTVKAFKERDVGRGSSDVRAPSRTVLQQVLEKKSTVYHVPAASIGSASLQGIKALVASPILNSEGHVIGALYGARFSSQSMQVPQISEIEATMVEVIACSAAAGIARELQQQKALEARVQFEQFFTPKMVAELEANPDLLSGRDADISVLFCDIVGFSSVSQRIGSLNTMQWISDVMHRLSEIVWENDGVVVDYIGDEMMAMWGAPKPQSDHALLACVASERLMNCREAINERWQSITGYPIDFRIGICSGIASVGNTGSLSRLKYGPLGNTVNLASRMQSAGKQLGVQQLVSHSTVQAIGTHPDIAFRPLGTARFVNIPEPISVFEIGSRQDPSFTDLVEDYENLVLQLQQGKFEEASATLNELSAKFPADKTTQILSQRLSLDGIETECTWPLETK